MVNISTMKKKPNIKIDGDGNIILKNIDNSIININKNDIKAIQDQIQQNHKLLKESVDDKLSEKIKEIINILGEIYNSNLENHHSKTNQRLLNLTEDNPKIT